MKNIKRLCCILILTALSLYLLPAPAFAMSGVDMSRIKFSENEKELSFKSGSINIEGGYVRQVYPFTEAEVEKLAREALSEKGLTQLDLVEANRAVEKARRATEFTAEDYEKWKEDMITTLSVTGVAGDIPTALELINKYMNSKSWDDIGIVSGDFLEGQAKDKVKDTAKGYIAEGLQIGSEFKLIDAWKGRIESIVKFAEVMADAHARTKQKWKAIAEGANAKRLLNEFYSLFQQKVDDYMRKSKEGGWIIKFDNCIDYRFFSFFGVPGNIQTWTLFMEMQKVQGDDFGSIAGTYKGVFFMNADFDMSEFERNTAMAAKKMEPLAELEKRYETDKNYRTRFITPQQKGSVYIGRTISGNCTAVIDKSGEITLTLHDDSDETTVHFRDVAVEFEVTAVSDKLGDLISVSIPIEISNKEQEIFLNGVSVGIKDFMPDLNINETFSGSGKPISVGWDKEIWKHWDGQEKKLILLD